MRTDVEDNCEGWPTSSEVGKPTINAQTARKRDPAHQRTQPDQLQISRADFKSARPTSNRHASGAYQPIRRRIPPPHLIGRANRTWPVVQTTSGRVDKIDPNGTRTRVTGMKSQCPRPLDDGAVQRSGEDISDSPPCPVGIMRGRHRV